MSGRAHRNPLISFCAIITNSFRGQKAVSKNDIPSVEQNDKNFIFQTFMSSVYYQRLSAKYKESDMEKLEEKAVLHALINISKTIRSLTVYALDWKLNTHFPNNFISKNRNH